MRKSQFDSFRNLRIFNRICLIQRKELLMAIKPAQVFKMEWEVEDFQATTKSYSQTHQICTNSHQGQFIKAIKRKCGNLQGVSGNTCLVLSIKNRTDQLILLLRILLNDKNNYKKVDNKAVDPSKVLMKNNIRITIFNRVTCLKKYRYRNIRLLSKSQFKFRVKESVRRVVSL